MTHVAVRCKIEMNYSLQGTRNLLENGVSKRWIYGQFWGAIEPRRGSMKKDIDTAKIPAVMELIEKAAELMEKKRLQQ